ncbi:predicted protein [Scheffersomyces stipitis CBS 6054]|uniref:DUF2433 domain-containing protein n=1 Tax=Scheffersomyces stipitis (strain ATCC 58785 / CBS 6054 / NBRC 10063 / NRRL Y-11545) TaxID=322104 RepID=A3LU08_PICST|nr:predicted protein [Scheffersomyces stipitis CBS 6054]ABN66502.2 predicted protein [Scheffersomyces stipitis CBS 6054]
MTDSYRILTISDIQGNLHAIPELYNQELQKGNPIDAIIHTGNFGFWDNDTIDEYKDLSYLKQIVAFSEVLEPEIVEELNNITAITIPAPTPMHIPALMFRSKLAESHNSISQFSMYLKGEFRFPCPVYTIFGPLDDPKIVEKIHSKEYVVSNLFLIDHTHNWEIVTPLESQPNIRLYGIGGTLKIHSLFDNGNLNYASCSGKVGELWITLIQVAELYINFMNTSTYDPTSNSPTSSGTINIFVSHAPVIKMPLLEHLAIITGADFTISQGLHFRYPVMGNGMSFVDSMGGSAGYIENYRSKFSRLRMILGELWLIIKDELLELLVSNEVPITAQRETLRNLIEVGLSLFDKIPISINDSIDKIIPLSLQQEFEEDLATNKRILKKINDFYFQAYYNLWHFNLCDHLSTPHASIRSSPHEYNVMIFKLDKAGNFKLDHSNSQGFNFNFKVQENKNSAGESDVLEEDNQYDRANSSFSGIEYSPKTGIKKPLLRASGDLDPDAELDEDELRDEDNIEDYERTKQFINSTRFYRGRIRGGGGRGNSFRGNKFRGRGRP